MNPCPKRLADVFVRPDGDHAVLHLRPSGDTVRLNSTALAIWELCDGSTTVDEIVAAVAELTGMTAEGVTQDVSTALTKLYRAGLIA